MIMPAIAQTRTAITTTMRKLKWMPIRLDVNSETAKWIPSPPFPAFVKKSDMNQPAVSAPSAKKAT
jgi:hypothetical protein